MWRRYRSTLVMSVPVGALIGIGLNLLVYLMGNPDYRNQGGWDAFLFTVVVGGVCGAGTALMAALGAMFAILLGEKSRGPSDRRRRSLGAAGAAVGAAALWLGVGAVNGLTTPAGWGWFGLVGILAAVAAAVAAGIAGALIAHADRRAARDAHTSLDTGDAERFRQPTPR